MVFWWRLNSLNPFPLVYVTWYVDKFSYDLRVTFQSAAKHNSPVSFHQSPQRMPVASIPNYGSATITTEWMHFSIFFPLTNCYFHNHKSCGHHLRYFFGRFPSAVQAYNLSFVKGKGFFRIFFQRDYSCLWSRREHLQYTFPVTLNSSYWVWGNIFMKKPIDKLFTYYLFLPGCDKLFGRTVYIFIFFQLLYSTYVFGMCRYTLNFLCFCKRYILF